MTIKTFAESHRLKTTPDVDGTTIIPGNAGQIYEHDDGTLAVMFLSERFKTREAWNTRRRQCEASGMELHQDGDFEGTLLFNPKIVRQVMLAIKIAGCRPKRVISPDHLAKLRAGLNASVLVA